MLEGKILITGGTGSLGKAVLKRARDENWNAEFTVIARNETKINETQKEFPNVRCIPGDVRDAQWLQTVFPGHNTILHAAALKIVPVAEANVREAVTTNVTGTLNVALAAVAAGVENAILISSDKACGPTYYGLTKRLGEGLFREANGWGNTRFVACRYGNVLLSSNSLLPLFFRQIKDNKPFTITDTRMTRFWLSMKQAVDLILQTLNTAKAGEIHVPKAPAMSIVDLARSIDSTREIVEIGIRPGERLHETLIVREEAQHTVDCGDHFIIHPPHTKVIGSLSFQYEYTSDNPEHWLTTDELHQLIKDS